MRKRCEGYRNQSPALPSRASCSRCFMALNPIVPIRKRKTKISPFLQLFAISNPRPPAKDEKIPPNSKFAAFLSQYRHLKKSQQPLIEKKLQKGRDFCFQNKWIAATRRLRQPAVPRWRVVAAGSVAAAVRQKRRAGKPLVALGLYARLLQASCVARYTLLYPIQRKKGSSCKTYLMALLALRTKPKSRIPIRLMLSFAPNIKSRRKPTLRRLRSPKKKCRQSLNTIGAGRG